jgi:hypothetical protein
MITTTNPSAQTGEAHAFQGEAQRSDLFRMTHPVVRLPMGVPSGQWTNPVLLGWDPVAFVA